MHQKVRWHTFKGLFGLVSAFGSGETIKYFLRTFQPSVTVNIGLHVEDWVWKHHSDWSASQTQTNSKNFPWNCNLEATYYPKPMSLIGSSKSARSCFFPPQLLYLPNNFSQLLFRRFCTCLSWQILKQATRIILPPFLPSDLLWQRHFSRAGTVQLWSSSQHMTPSWH